MIPSLIVLLALVVLVIPKSVTIPILSKTEDQTDFCFNHCGSSEYLIFPASSTKKSAIPFTNPMPENYLVQSGSLYIEFYNCQTPITVWAEATISPVCCQLQKNLTNKALNNKRFKGVTRSFAPVGCIPGFYPSNMTIPLAAAAVRQPSDSLLNDNCSHGIFIIIQLVAKTRLVKRFFIDIITLTCRFSSYDSRS